MQNYPVIRYDTQKGFYIDLMTRLKEAFSFENLKYEIIESQGIKNKIATPESLYDLKKNTFREKDKMDVLCLNATSFGIEPYKR
ncbi:MAG: hypothetical protein R6V04_04010 [bacterium]